MNQTADSGRHNTYLAAVIIVAAILISASIFFAASTFTTTVTRTSTETTTLLQSTSTTQTNSTVCSITGEPFGVVLRAVSDSGSPIAGAQATGQTVAYCDGQPQVHALPAVTTNSSGFASFLEGYPGSYQLSLTYAGRQYNLTVPTQPMYASYVTYSIPSGNMSTSFCFANTKCSGESSQTSTGVVYTVNAAFVSRFCSNSSTIQRSGGTSQAAGLQSSGSLSIGFSFVGTGWRNAGSSSLPVEAVCIDAIGIVPANDTTSIIGPTATTLELVVSSSGPIQPDQEVNISARFTGGSGIYYMPQGGIGITVIAADGSSVSERGPEGVGFLTTARSPAPLVSMENASLLAGNSPVLSALLRFNSGASPISEVDIYVNGTYIGTAGVGHDTASPGAPGQYDVYYNIRVIEPGRVSIIHGARYAITFVAATRGFTETSASVTVVAEPSRTGIVIATAAVAVLFGLF